MFKVHVKYRISDDARASFAQYQNKCYFLEKIILNSSLNSRKIIDNIVFEKIFDLFSLQKERLAI